MSSRTTYEVGLHITRKPFCDTLEDQVHKLGSMDVPTLIVWGREDKSIPLPVGEEMHRILRGSRLEIFDHAGHCPHDENCERFNQLVLDFLAPEEGAG